MQYSFQGHHLKIEVIHISPLTDSKNPKHLVSFSIQNSIKKRISSPKRSHESNGDGTGFNHQCQNIYKYVSYIFTYTSHTQSTLLSKNINYIQLIINNFFLAVRTFTMSDIYPLLILFIFWDSFTNWLRCPGWAYPFHPPASTSRDAGRCRDPHLWRCVSPYSSQLIIFVKYVI